jgi:hypothetical protein
MKAKTKTILFIVLSFLVGIVVGWLLENRIFKFATQRQIHRPREFHKILTDRLHLDERQVFQVDSILEIHKQKMDEFRKQSLALRDTMRIDIRKILKPEQATLFDDFTREMSKRESKKKIGSGHMN